MFKTTINGPLARQGRAAVVRLITAKDLPMNRIEPLGDAGSHRQPAGLDLLLHQFLGGSEICDPGETVPLTYIGQSRTLHLPGQPLPSIQAYLDTERKPSLQAGTHKAELRINPVVIYVQTLASFPLQI